MISQGVLKGCLPRIPAWRETLAKSVVLVISLIYTCFSALRACALPIRHRWVVGSVPPSCRGTPTPES